MNIHDPDLWLRLNRATTFEAVGEGVLHDLRNPLQGIAMAARTIVDAPTDAEMVARLAPVILQASDKLEQALDRLSGAHLRAHDPRTQPTVISGVITNAVSVLGDLSKRRRPPITADVPAGLPAVHSVESYLRHAMINLLLNASEATETQPDGHIFVKAELRDDDVIVAVDDNGPGIPPAHYERVFDAFFTTKQERGHLGLGLSVAQHLAGMWGGSLRVSPSKAGGLRIVMSLRAVSQPTPASR